MKQKYYIATVAGLFGFCSQIDIASAQVEADTILANGGTLAVTSDLNAKNTAGAHTGYAAVDFDATGSITGAANITVRNNASTSEPGVGTIYGLYSDNPGVLTTTGYTGNITVVNDRSAAPSAGDTSANAYGFYGSAWDGNLGNMSVTALAGTSTTGDAYVGVAYGIDGDIEGDLSGNIQVTAMAGTATATGGDADAYIGDATAIYGDIEGNLLGDVNVTAIAGTATSSDENADAYIEYAYGTYGDIGGNLSGDINVTAIAGTATSSDGNADAYIYYANAIEGDIAGDLSGTLTLYSKAGKATATNGYANVYQYFPAAVYGDIAGNLSGVITATVLGGTADATNGNAYANLDYANVLYGDLTGDLTGTVSVNSKGGTATASGGDADAYMTYQQVIYGDIEGDLTGSVSATGIGGHAKSTTGDANAYISEATGVDGDIGGDLTGTISVTAIGGTAVSPMGTADASVYAYGVSGDVTGIVSGNIKVVAQAGLENGVSAYVEAYGINTDKDLTFSNATIYAQAYESSGTLILDNSYAIRSGGALDFIGGVNNLTGGVYASSANIADATTMNLNGVMNLSGNLDVGAGSTLGLRIGRVGLPTIATVDGTATFNSSKLTLRDTVGATVNSVDGQVLVEAGTLVGDLGTEITVNDQSIFDFTVTRSGESLILGDVTVDQQSSPATGLAQANTSAARAVMQNANRNLGSARRTLRGASGDSMDSPEGPSGPPPIKQDEVVAYLNQFNDIGGLDSQGANSGYDWQTSGYAIGAEKLINDNLIMGIAGGQTFTDLDGYNNSGDGDSEMFYGTVYGSVFDEVKYVEAGFFYSHADNDTHRIDTISNRYSGNYDSTHFGTWVEAGFTYKETADSRIEPYARASYISGDNDGFTDAGGMLPMTYDSSSTNNLLLESGARYTKTHTLNNGTILNAKFNAAIRVELLDDSVNLDTVIAGTGQRVSSPDADRLSLLLGLGLDWEATDQLTFGVNYEPTISGNWYNHSVDFAVRYSF